MIGAGHRPSSLPDYTLAQVRLYLGAIARARAGERREQLFLLRAAQADKKGFEKIWKELGREAEQGAQ